MATRQKRPEGLEFETFPGRADIQISKTLTTPAGNEVRAIVATSGKVVLTGVGEPSDDLVILEGFDEDEDPVVYMSWVDFLKPFVDELAKKVVGGGGQTCTSTVTVTQDNKTGTTTTTMTQTCKPA